MFVYFFEILDPNRMYAAVYLHIVYENRKVFVKLVESTSIPQQLILI